MTPDVAEPLGPERLRDLGAALQLEWLETNGIGGYASSTVVGAHTRRFHGLLVAALAPPVARHSMLTALDVAVIHRDRDHALSCHLYPDAVYPQGHLRLVRFERVPFPRWTYELEDGPLVTHELWLDPGRNTAVLVWRVAPGAPPLQLSVVPLLGLRDFRTLTHRAPQAPAFHELAEGCLTVHAHAPLVAPLHLHFGQAAIECCDRWYRQFQLVAEQGRESECEEDLWNPCSLTFALGPDLPAVLVASTDETAISDLRAFAEESLQRRLADERRYSLPAADHGSRSGPRTDLGRLAPAVRAYRVERLDSRQTILAGYHALADWGRDTMLALPGLFLVHGHTAGAIAVLRDWMRFLDGGMLPNRFPEPGDAVDYESVDAALWLAVAVLRTWLCLGGRGPDGLVPRGDLWGPPQPPEPTALSPAEAAFLGEALEAIERVIAGHQHGTRHGIRVDADGLIAQGAPGLALTWMDARWEGQPFTPRHGKPIEIQALWFNTLHTAALLHRVHGDAARAAERESMAARVARAVEEQFWHPAGRGLADLLDPEGRPDLSVRPNQLLAVSLPFPLVPRERAGAVLEAVEGPLLTPFGLRTLDPADPNHRGRCDGPHPVRDAAYHQGTVWPWLVGAFVDAALRVRGATAANIGALCQALQPLLDHVNGQAGLGHVSEMFESDPPHQPRGGIASARAVAELLRALWVLERVG